MRDWGPALEKNSRFVEYFPAVQTNLLAVELDHPPLNTVTGQLHMQLRDTDCPLQCPVPCSQRVSVSRSAVLVCQLVGSAIVRHWLACVAVSCSLLAIVRRLVSWLWQFGWY